MKPLHILSDEILRLETVLEEAEELRPEARAGLVDAWLEAQADVAIKLDNYAALIKELNARAAARKKAADEMRELAQMDANQADLLIGRLKRYFELHGLTRFETARFKIALQANGGVVPLCYPAEWEEEPASAPEAFQRRVIQLDKLAIREAIRNDEESHGARLAERDTHIRIR